MVGRITTALAALAAMLLASPGFSDQPVNSAGLIRDLYDLESLPLVKASKCRQFSSYDRTGGNNDSGNFLSIDSNRTALLAEMNGPGAIVRIWSANPGGNLRIYLDGAAEPVIDMPFDKLFTDPALQPIRTTSSGGWISYWPIPYQKHCKVIVENAPGFYYHVTYQTYKPGQKVETYTKELSPVAKTEMESALKVWRDPEKAYLAATKSTLGTSPKPKKESKTVTAAPGATTTIFETKGPACIDRLHVETDTPGLDLQHTIIRAYWDGEKSPSIEAPLMAFFMHDLRSEKFASLPIVTSPGDYECRFPMPFAKSGRIEVVNGSKKPITLSVTVDYRRFSRLNRDAAYFHAKWNHEITKQGVPYTILQAKGQGHFVGVALTMQGDKGIWFLEGDELIYVDGEKQQSFNGTGTEDYFNSGWYFASGPIAMPLHGALVKEEGLYRVMAYRMQIPDCVPFEKDIAVKIEHGGMSDYPGADYSSVAYFYQKEPHFDFFTMPPAEKTELAKGQLPSVLNSMDAETLKPKADAGKLAIVDWDTLTLGVKGTPIAILTPDTDGASISFKVNVGMRDRYELSGFLVKGRDFGKVICTVDGKAGETMDLSSNGDPFPAQQLTLAKMVFEAAEHEVTLKVAGKTASGKLPNIGVVRLLLTSASPFIGEWQVIGPFDNKGIDSVLPPETDGFKADASYDGKAAKVTWTKVASNGGVYLHDRMSPSEKATAFAFTGITSPDSRETELLIGADDECKVWLNGTEIWRQEGTHDLYVDQDRIKITLKPGENTLLLKIGNGGGYWGYVARLRDPDGVLRYSAGP